MKNIILPYKDRELDLDKPVRVYRNLNKGGVWYSLVQNGKTVAHSSALCLKDCDFIVNEKGRLRVLKNKKKEFHAYIKGWVVPKLGTNTAQSHELTATIKYNPFKTNSFMCHIDKKSFKVIGASWVICNEEGVKAEYLVS